MKWVKCSARLPNEYPYAERKTYLVITKNGTDIALYIHKGIWEIGENRIEGNEVIYWLEPPKE